MQWDGDHCLRTLEAFHELDLASVIEIVGSYAVNQLRVSPLPGGILEVESRARQVCHRLPESPVFLLQQSHIGAPCDRTPGRGFGGEEPSPG
jgi:hypothetical protein